MEGDAAAGLSDIESPDALARIWLECDDIARFLLDDRLAVLWTNDPAARCLEEQTDLELRDGLLCTVNRALQASLSAFISNCTSELSTLCLACEDDGGHFLFRARELCRDGQRRYFGVACHQSTDRLADRYGDVRTAFNLTISEYRVLEKMLDGYTADDISAEGRLSVETIRTHIRHIYSKLGVASREALFARIQAYRI